jgi:hypothetical protein
MSQGKDLRKVGDRIEALLQELGRSADPRLRANSEELVRLLMDLYGAALARVLEIIDDTGSADEIFDPACTPSHIFRPSVQGDGQYPRCCAASENFVRERYS